MGVLPLLLVVAACTEPVVVFEEPAAVETCEWLVPVGVELVNDYVYTLQETDLSATGGDPSALPTSLIALNTRGQELDARAVELECDLVVLNEAIVEATAGIESDDPAVRVFLETVRGGIVEASPVVGEWSFVSGVTNGVAVAPLPDYPITLLIDEGSASGSSGCNSYYFPAQLDDGLWVWGEGAATTTELLCVDELGAEDIAAMAAEEAYAGAFEIVVGYTIDGDQLVLTGEGVELRFVRFVDEPDSTEG